MRRILTTTVALAAVAAMSLTACSSRDDGTKTTTDSASASSTADAGATTGFPAASLIGVALPSKTSENWVLAGGLFEDGLKAAGFKGDVQYAGASSPVADQQSQ